MNEGILAVVLSCLGAMFLSLSFSKWVNSKIYVCPTCAVHLSWPSRYKLWQSSNPFAPRQTPCPSCGTLIRIKGRSALIICLSSSIIAVCLLWLDVILIFLHKTSASLNPLTFFFFVFIAIAVGSQVFIKLEKVIKFGS